jgi:hypothetical protein
MSAPVAIATAARKTCYAHPDVPHTGRCDRCERPICETCAFSTAAGRLCPECMVGGNTVEQRRSSATFSIVGLVCAAGVVLCLASVLFAGSADVFTVGMVASLVGITTSLVGRDFGRRTGSPLSLISVIANAVLLGIYGLLIVIGLVRQH